MASPYTTTSVSGYNSNPPPDDGSTVATNLQKWSDVKTKIGDPLNTFASNVDGNISSAFGKTLDGSAVVSTAIDYTATASDQGRLITVTASGHTVTTPDATVVGTPFLFAVSNQSNGNITLKGSGAQNVDGSNTKTINAGGSCIVKTDGSNWFTVGATAADTDTYYTPDVQIFTSGSAATYTTATNGGNRPLYLRIRMVAGGGGGGAGTVNSGTNGGDTSFDTWTAIHGAGGAPANGSAGAGGSGGVNGTGTVITRVAGQNGLPGGTTFYGYGGASFFGGAGVNVSGATSAGGAAAANSGSGGEGGQGSGASNGSGGGAGEFVEFIIVSPAATYTYTVGAAGSGGAAGTQAGGNGAAGRIEVIGYWQ